MKILCFRHSTTKRLWSLQNFFAAVSPPSISRFRIWTTDVSAFCLWRWSSFRGSQKLLLWILRSSRFRTASNMSWQAPPSHLIDSYWLVPNWLLLIDYTSYSDYYRLQTHVEASPLEEIIAGDDHWCNDALWDLAINHRSSFIIDAWCRFHDFWAKKPTISAEDPTISGKTSLFLGKTSLFLGCSHQLWSSWLEP